MGSEQLCSSILSKVQEQIERTLHLIALVPGENLNWQPSFPSAWPIAILLGHILEALAGFCAVLAAVEPKRLAHFAELREAPVNHSRSPSEAIRRILIYRSHIEEGFSLLKDTDLGDIVPTVFVHRGELLMTLLLGNLEHLINHKHQLFMYLKCMGVAVNTRDLYHFRGE
jgi:hypothetical protein